MNISLKLIAGHKVILAEHEGYETELFVPVIVNNRITLQNAVVSRRCCQANTEEKLPKNRLSIHDEVPLANSTPSHKLNKENVICSIKKRSMRGYSIKQQFNLPKDVTIKPLQESRQNIRQTQPSPPIKDIPNKNNKLPTPDIVRRAPAPAPNDSIPLPEYPIVTRLKIVPLHRVNTSNTPKQLAKIIRSKTPLMANSSSPKVLRNLSNVSSFGSPPSLQQTNSIRCGTPNQSFLGRQINTPGSAPKWRKCITPLRTYIRNSNAVPRTSHLQPLRLSKNGKFIEEYRYPINVKNRFILKKRKLIVDSQIKISPKKFKQQLINTDDLHAEKSQLPRSRRSFFVSHMTAFDLLTNSGFYPKVGNKLNTVFRNGCVNKSAATIPKYKQLIKDVPLLQE